MQQTTIGECVCIHIGQAGLQMGSACWELLAAEHGVLANGTLRDGNDVEASMKTFFNETPSGQIVPRSILVDTEPTVIDEIRLGKYAHFFHPDLMLNGMEDSASNYARARNSRGQGLLPIMAEKIRMVVENCDKLQGFILFDSFAGGTGTGLGANILQVLDFEFHRLPCINLGVFPSEKNAPVIVEPYNSIFFMRDLIENSDIGFVVDNEALYKICKTQLRHQSPTYHCLNRLAAQVVSMLTSSIRYESFLNSDLSQLRTNIIPYPKFKFPIISYAPMYSAMCRSHHTLTTQELTDSVFLNSNQLCEIDLREGIYMANAMLYRGGFSVADVNKSVQYMKQQNNWVSWCPTGFKIGVCPVKPLYLPDSILTPSDKAVMMLSNNTAFVKPLRRLRHRYAYMFSKRAFVHWYVGEGMEEQEFLDSYQEVFDLCNCYKEVEKGEGLQEIKRSKHYVKPVREPREPVEEDNTIKIPVSRDRSAMMEESGAESLKMKNQSALGDVEDDTLGFEDEEDDDDEEEEDEDDEYIKDEPPKEVHVKKKGFWKKRLLRMLKKKLMNL